MITLLNSSSSTGRVDGGSAMAYFQRLPGSPGQALDHQGIGIIHHAFDLAAGNTAIEGYGIPVSLVHVIARFYRGKNISQDGRLIGLALEVHAGCAIVPRVAVYHESGEHFAPDFHNGDFRAKRKVLDGLRFTEQVLSGPGIVQGACLRRCCR